MLLQPLFPTCEKSQPVGEVSEDWGKMKKFLKQLGKKNFSMFFAHLNTFTFLHQLNLRKKNMDYIRYPRFSLILSSSNLVVLSNNVQRYFLWEDIKLSLKCSYRLKQLMILETKVQPKDKDRWCLWITGINTNSPIVCTFQKKSQLHIISCCVQSQYLASFDREPLIILRKC